MALTISGKVPGKILFCHCVAKNAGITFFAIV